MGTSISTRAATRPRWLFTTLIALALALGGLSGIGPSPAAAQQDDEPITQRDFDRLTRAAQKNEIVYGPEAGSLELEEGEFVSVDTGLDVENFLVHAVFTNPYAAAEGPWDYGVQFRLQRSGILVLVLFSDGSWAVVDEEAILADGEVEGINGGAADTNAIDLYVEGEIAHFALNGDYVATVELTVDGAGDLGLFSNFISEDFPANAETEYSEFIVWALDEGDLGPDEETPDPDDEETPDPDDLDDEDLTATAEAQEEEDDLTATAEAEEENGADDPTYTSPTYGYSLSYEEPWDLVDESSEDGADILELETRDSSLQFVGVESRDSTEECLDGIIANLEDNQDVTDVEIAQDDRDRDMREDTDELSWVVLNVVSENEDGEEAEITAYYECRVIEEGESLLTVTHLALSDDYNDEIENRTAVLDTLEIDGGVVSGDEERPTEEPDAETPTEEAEDEPTREPDEEPTEEATVESDLPEGSVAIFVEAVGDSGVNGFGLIEPSGTDGSLVTLLAFGASGFVTIHEGSCRNPDATPAFEVGQLDPSGRVEAEVEAPVEELTNGDYVMIVSEDGTTDAILACGDLSTLAV